MLRGTTGESKRKFETDLASLKVGLEDSRHRYFEMEEKCQHFMKVGRIGGAETSGSMSRLLGGPDVDDHFIRDSNVRNIEMLREAEKNLGNIMEMGDEAHQNMREANLDLHSQR